MWLPSPSVSATRSGAVEIDAVEMEEVRILVRGSCRWRGTRSAACLVDAIDAADHPLALGDLVLDLPPFGVDQVQMPPAVALGGPEDLVAVAEVMAVTRPRLAPAAGEGDGRRRRI